jgi:hypothetical protein
MPANYSEVFHMYEAKCSYCGYEESGTFVPSTSGMPVSKPVTAQIIIGEALPNSHNLMWLRKLHPRFANLSPSELKEAFLNSQFIELPELYAEELEQIKTKCKAMCFQIIVKE